MKTWEIKLMELLAIGTLTDCTPTLLNPIPVQAGETEVETRNHINMGHRAYKFRIKPELEDTIGCLGIGQWTQSLRAFVHLVHTFYEGETES